MDRKAFPLSFAVIAALTFMLFVGVALANPFMPSGSWSDEPVAPVIIIESPTWTGQHWIGSEVWLNFTVSVPITDWYSTSHRFYPESYATTMGQLTDVRFSLDDNPEIAANKISESPLKASHIYNPQSGISHYSVNLGQLSAGQHSVTITAEGLAYFGNLTHSAFSDSFGQEIQESDQIRQVNNSAQCTFIVVAQQPTPLSSVSPTVFIIAAFATTLTAAVGLLFSFRKFRR
ncbi:MAG: hypothetical protein NWE92_08140 [Candidatus Bathyarchaeota archaeon]|nr:hypothetical protein [Candidatus Bathyarchaeota archaeon]